MTLLDSIASMTGYDTKKVNLLNPLIHIEHEQLQQQVLSVLVRARKHPLQILLFALR